MDNINISSRSISVYVVVASIVHSSGEDNDFGIIGVFSDECSAKSVCENLISLNLDRDISFCVECYPVL